MHPGQVELRGDGLVLRSWTDADAAAAQALFDDPQIARWTPLESPFDAAAARRYLDRAADRARTGEALQLAVTTDGVEPVGEVLLFDRGADRHGDEAAELGYMIGAAHRGRGLARRAVRLLGAHARDVLGVRQLVLRIGEGNLASERVALACGYRPTRSVGAAATTGKVGRLELAQPSTIIAVATAAGPPDALVTWELPAPS